MQHKNGNINIKLKFNYGIFGHKIKIALIQETYKKKLCDTTTLSLIR